MAPLSQNTHPFRSQLRALTAVAGMSIRAAMRSRVVTALLVLLTAGVLGIPRLVTGDGTPASEMQVRLQYTLVFACGILGLATLWSSCAAFGAEIDSRRMELTAVKPVHPLTLWLGRWLGILLLDLLLLLGVVTGVRIQLGYLLSPADAATLLVSRSVSRPELPDPEQEARRAFAELQRANRLPTDLPPAVFFRQLVQENRNRYVLLHPGEGSTWTFRLPQPVAAEGRLAIRMRFDTEAAALASVRGLCRLRRSGESAWSAEVPINELARNELELAVLAPQLAGTRVLELEFVDQSASDSAALLIQPRRALSVLTPQGTFSGNLVRVILAQCAILAALAALGLTLGACFSFPVAAFTATTLLLVVLVSAGNAPANLQEAFPAELHPGWAEQASFAITRSVDALTQPLLQPEPLAQAVAGERVPSNELYRVLFWGALAYPLLLALLADRVLRRRELAKQSAGG